MVNQIKINNNKRKSIGAYLEESTSGISVGKDMGQDMDKELAFEMIVLMMFYNIECSCIVLFIKRIIDGTNTEGRTPDANTDNNCLVRVRAF